MIGDLAGEAGPDVLHAEHIDEEVGQLVRAPRQVLGPLMPDRVVVEQLGIFQLDHGRARPGRRDDRSGVGEGANGVPGQVAGVGRDSRC